jgi:hypothetical protein
MAQKDAHPHPPTPPAALRCVTCRQTLPPGKEPEYFGQVSIDYSPEHEVERAAEDVSQFLRYAKDVNTAIWDALLVAEADPPNLPGKESFLDSARALGFLLTDLVDEANKRVWTLRELVDEKIKNTKDTAKKED